MGSLGFYGGLSWCYAAWSKTLQLPITKPSLSRLQLTANRSSMKNLLPAILLFLSPSIAGAQIHIGFHNAADTSAAMAPGTAPLAQGSVVDTSTATWNAVTRSGAYSFSNLPLTSADATASGAKLSGNTGFTNANTNGWATRNKDSVMMEGWYGFKGAESLKVSSLPAAYTGKFHVIVYGDSNDLSRTMSYTIGGTTKTIQDSANFSGTFSAGENYVVFTGLTGSSFTLTGNAAAATRSCVNGISIIPGDPLPPLAIQSFTASKLYVSPGTPVTLTWETLGADSVEISPAIGTVTGTSKEVNVTETTTYTLTARRGAATATAKLRVGAGPARPNILIFLADDMGAMDTQVPFATDASGIPVVMPLNQRYRTPAMIDLAKTGMKFTSAYACTVCSPTRTSLMSGLNSTRHHVSTWTALSTPQDTGDPVNTHNRLPPTDWKKAGIEPNSKLLPRLMQNAGYRTISVGKGHFGPNSEPISDPRAIGFDVNIAGSGLGGPGSYLGTQNFVKSNPAYQVPGLSAYHGQDIFLTEALTQEMSAQIDKAKTDEIPFFAYMSHYAIHATFEDADKRFTANYPTLSGYEKNFATLVEGMDRSLEDLVKQLNTLGIAENTLIVFLGDNGSDSPIPLGPTQNGPCAPYRGKKGFAYEGGSRVPMLVSWAKRNPNNPFQQALPIPAESITTDMVEVWDVMPTILHAAGLPPEPTPDAHDLVPYLRGEAGTHRPQEFVLNFPHSHEYEDYYALLRKDHWKLIYRYETGNYELFNLANDMSEQTNLANDPAQANRLMQLSRHLARQLKDLDAQPPRDRLAAGNPQTTLLTPNLPAVDSDDDGINDLIEDPNRNGLVDADETDSDNADTDGDGTKDGVEIRSGTDPLNSTSYFRVLPSIRPDGGLFLEWPSKPGATYRVEASHDLVTWPDVLASAYPAGAAATTEYDVGAPTPGARFFRVGLE